jgi:hypothetical protein
MANTGKRTHFQEKFREQGSRISRGGCPIAARRRRRECPRIGPGANLGASAE